ncbi:hypothetical protein B0H16DRAFT_581785 [Mycena metata]|uniref:Uncharacterized protein n=1 Tax=Mycena metata TaxID=1033252 RepID=A0AAD7ME49_9AGAR|nr:hypothetical protein B0H16DRAFT_581785 [Mycena metata]
MLKTGQSLWRARWGGLGAHLFIFVPFYLQFFLAFDSRLGHLALARAFGVQRGLRVMSRHFYTAACVAFVLRRSSFIVLVWRRRRSPFPPQLVRWRWLGLRIGGWSIRAYEAGRTPTALVDLALSFFFFLLLGRCNLANVVLRLCRSWGLGLPERRSCVRATPCATSIRALAGICIFRIARTHSARSRGFCPPHHGHVRILPSTATSLPPCRMASRNVFRPRCELQSWGRWRVGEMMGLWRSSFSTTAEAGA